MITKFDFPCNHPIGHHSNWSRYRSCNPLDVPGRYDYSYDPELFPERDWELFRLITLNCNRFPRTIWSTPIFTCLILSALPDVLILQEVKCMSDVRQVVSIIRKHPFNVRYGFRNGKEWSSGLNVAVVYNTDRLSDSVRTEPFIDFDIEHLYSLRRPGLLSSVFQESPLDVMNLHGVSRTQREDVAIRFSCLTEMTNYFSLPGNDDHMIIGGDWNIDSNSKLLLDHFPNFNFFISNYFNNSDHFLVSKDLIAPVDIGRCSQYQMNIQEYLQLSEADYLLYMSDHFPVVLDIPTNLL